MALNPLSLLRCRQLVRLQNALESPRATPSQHALGDGFLPSTFFEPEEWSIILQGAQRQQGVSNNDGQEEQEQEEQAWPGNWETLGMQSFRPMAACLRGNLPAMAYAFRSDGGPERCDCCQEESHAVLDCPTTPCIVCTVDTDPVRVADHPTADCPRINPKTHNKEGESSRTASLGPYELDTSSPVPSTDREHSPAHLFRNNFEHAEGCQPKNGKGKDSHHSPPMPSLWTSTNPAQRQSSSLFPPETTEVEEEPNMPTLDDGSLDFLYSLKLGDSFGRAASPAPTPISNEKRKEKNSENNKIPKGSEWTLPLRRTSSSSARRTRREVMQTQQKAPRRAEQDKGILMRAVRNAARHRERAMKKEDEGEVQTEWTGRG